MAQEPTVPAAGSGACEEAKDPGKDLSEKSCTTSGRSDYYTTIDCLSNYESASLILPESSAPSSSSPYFSPRIQRLSERKSEFENMPVEFAMEAATSHFTELDCVQDDDDDDDVVKSNQEMFDTLKNDPELGYFFGRSLYQLKMGALLGKGGQAEVYEATGSYKLGGEEEALAVKVFDKGFPLESLKQLWPPGLMSKSVPWRSLCSQSQGAGCCWAVGAQVLDDGRFAFVFPRHAGDLRSRIDEVMLRRNNIGPPFELKEACKIMVEIARAMESLHREGFLHRDLKASNVLCEKLGFRATNVLCGSFYVADFESSVGTVGTSVWRAPEIVLALRNRRSNRSLELPFTCAADVYSYAMTF